MPKKHSLQKRVKESRVSKARLEVRSTKQGRSLEGYFAVYNSQSENLGGFVEVIAPGAFDKSLRTQQVTALIDHDAGRLVGKTGVNMTLESNSAGLRFRIRPLPDTSQVNDLLALADQALIDSCSFGFYAVSDEWGTLSDGTPLRTVTEAIIFEGSILTGNEPAYTATSVSARALARAKKRDDDNDDLDPECDPDSDEYDEDECQDDRAICQCDCRACKGYNGIPGDCVRCERDDCAVKTCRCERAKEVNKLRAKLGRHMVNTKPQPVRSKYADMDAAQLLAVIERKMNS